MKTTGYYDVTAVEPQRDLIRVYNADGEYVHAEFCHCEHTHAVVAALRAGGRCLSPRSKLPRDTDIKRGWSHE